MWRGTGTNDAINTYLAIPQIERMRGRQHRQQMRAPQLRRTQGVPPPASKLARANLGNVVIRGVRTHQFQQSLVPTGGKVKLMPRLQLNPASTTPHLYRRSSLHLNPLQKLSEHPLIGGFQVNGVVYNHTSPHMKGTLPT